MSGVITEEFYEFFKKLAGNNNKEWFDENRNWYEKSVKEPFDDLCTRLIEEKAKRDKAYLELLSKDVIFRVNRDIRFSKDKTPYKLNRSALIAIGGRKSMSPAGFYFELGPGENAFYAGAYMPEKPRLANLRNYIASHAVEFKSIISDKSFVKAFGEVQGEKNKRLDATLMEAAKEQPLLFNTQFYLKHSISDAVCMSDKLVGYLLDLDEKAGEFGKFMVRGMAGVS